METSEIQWNELTKATKDPPEVDQRGNPTTRQKCSCCRFRNRKRFTIAPPPNWTKDITWQYNSKLIVVLRELLLIRLDRKGLFFTLPKDVFFYLMKHVVTEWNRQIKPRFREVCDDCVYHHQTVAFGSYNNP